MVTKVAFHLSGLSGLSSPTSQFLNRTHEFSELVLARMALLMDQSRSVLQLQSAKARKFGELWRENVRVRLRPFHLYCGSEPVLFGRTGPTNGKLSKTGPCTVPDVLFVCLIDCNSCYGGLFPGAGCDLHVPSGGDPWVSVHGDPCSIPGPPRHQTPQSQSTRQRVARGRHFVSIFQTQGGTPVFLVKV